MPLHIKNDTNLLLKLAFARWDPNCRGTKWRKVGWFHLAPGQTVTPWDGESMNKDFLYFARDINETIKWDGNYYTHLPLGWEDFSNGLDSYFDQCWDYSSGRGINRGMQLIRPTTEGSTLELFLR